MTVSQVPALDNTGGGARFTMTVDRADQGLAVYSFYDNGVLKYSANGWWDDATPWESGTYTATRGKNRFANNTGPMWDFVDDPVGRTAVQLHIGSSPANSHGCLIAPTQFLKNVDAYIKGTGAANSLEITVNNDFDVQLDISTSAVQVEEGNSVTITVSLTGAGAVNGISKDIYVRVDLISGSTASTADYEFTGPNLVNLWTNVNKAGGANFDANALHLKIPAGQTSASFQMKTNVDDDSVLETAKFKVGDYAIYWKLDPYGLPYLYSDSAKPKILINPDDKVSIDILPAPSPDDGTLHLEGSTGRYERVINVTQGRTYQFAFEAYDVPDAITIFDGVTTYVNTGFVSGLNTGQFTIDPRSTGRLTVVVVGNSQTSTQWVIDVGPAGTLAAAGQAPAHSETQEDAALAALPAQLTPGTDATFDLTTGQSQTASASLQAGKTYTVVAIPLPGSDIDPSIVLTSAGGNLSFDNFLSTGNAAGIFTSDANETVNLTFSGGEGPIRVVFKEVAPAALNVFAVQLAQTIIGESAVAEDGTQGFTIFRFGSTAGTASVSWRLVPNGTTAVDAADFGGQLPSGTISFAAGEMQAFVDLNLPVDSLSEAPEGFRIELFNPVGAGLATVETNGLGSTGDGQAIDTNAAPRNDDGTLDNDVIYGGAPDDILSGQNGNDFLIGRQGNDTLKGDSGNDTLEGGDGNDSLDGGTELDTATYFSASRGVVVDLSLTVAQNTVGAGVDLLVNIEDLIGSSFADVLYGNAAANFLEGGFGSDVMAGRAGNDLYFVDDFADTVIEAAGEGLDTVRSLESFALPENVEDLILTGTEATTGIGNAGNNAITGNAAANRLSGGSGDDILDGGAGGDVMAGGLGNDTFVVDNALDEVRETPAGGTDTVRSSVSFTLAAEVEKLFLEGAAYFGVGNVLDNVIDGNGINNLLDGKEGADTMTGRAGDDLYIVDNAGDKVIENAFEGYDNVLSTVTFTLGANLEQLQLEGTAVINGFGNSLDNVIYGNASANRMEGGAGNDVLIGQGGLDTLVGGAGNDRYDIGTSPDVIIEAAGGGIDVVWTQVSYTLAAEVEDLLINGAGAINGTGNALANRLTGNSDANQLDGRGGADIMDGGAGNDTYVVDDIGDQVLDLSPFGGVDQVYSSVSYTLGDNVENLALTGTGAINGTGNVLNNVLAGNSAANVLDGAGGADLMKGGAGNDVYIVDVAGDQAIELLAGDGVDRVESAASFVLGANIENLVLTGIAAINGTGNGLANAITGNGAANTLDGRAGADVMKGGAGDDIYVVDQTGDQAIELAAGDGSDQVYSSVSFTLGANLEFLGLTGSAAINGTGNADANSLTGNGAANTLDGKAGADIMKGGAGNDIYIVDNVADQTIELFAADGNDSVYSSVSYTLGTNLEFLGLTGTAAINGTGNAGNNSLTGNAAANVLDGRGGADVMKGGAGNDTYVVDSVADQTVELLATDGNDQVLSSVSYTLAANVEALTLTGTAALNGNGNAADNALTGNAAANTLDGRGGVDVMKGGAGNDIYVVDNSADQAIELNAADGNDQVYSSVTYTLGANVEFLGLTGTAAINGNGNASNNSLTGNAAANTLDGRGGADVMKGGAGNDIYVVDNSADQAIELNAADGNDQVYASASFTIGANIEFLGLTGTAAIDGTGSASANAISGNGAANVLDGRDGADTLKGGAGADGFKFSTALGAANVDHIIDFEVGTDKILLDDAIFTRVVAGALAAGAFRTGTAAVDADDRIIYDPATGKLLYDLDGSGAGAAVQFAMLDNRPATLSAADFTVI